jgi:hypothetical protein
MIDTVGGPMHFNDDALLGACREWLREQLAEHGAHCPLCTQMAKIYRRSLGSGMARHAITAWRAAGVSEFHAPTVLRHEAGDFAKIRYWGLIVAVGSRPAGWWRFTELGQRWALGLVGVPRYAYVFDAELLRLGEEGPQNWTIHDALGDPFDYAALMSAPGTAPAPI